MRFMSAVIALALFSSVAAQEKLVLQEMPSPAAIIKAEDTIRAAKKSAVNLKFGGYATIEIKIEGNLETYVVPGSDDCITTEPIEKGKSKSGFMVDKNESQFKWTTIPAADVNRVNVYGTAPGTSTLIWMTVKEGKPVVVAAFQFVVGDPQPQPEPPAPKPPVPSDPLIERLRQAAVKDAVSGKSDKVWLPRLALIYETASNIPASIKNLEQLEAALYENRVQIGMPEPDVLFTNLRQAIKGEIYSALGITGKENLASILMDSDRIQKASGIFKRISVALTEIAK